MSFRERIISIIVTILFSVFALIPLFVEKIEAKEQPQKLYQVYLDGQSVGIIRSKTSLETYINREQKALKQKYNVTTVYLPQGLYIAEYVGYSKNILTEEEMYRRIKDIRPFTIKGYVVTIDKDPVIKINVLKKDFFSNAVNNTVKAFVNVEEFNAFMNEETEEIKTIGKRIEDLYVKEDITIKEALIPSDEKIFSDEKELTRYVLFGNLNESKEYSVKSGDTIESIAFDNKMGIEDFLVINPEFSNMNNLLYVGKKVKVGAVSPIISVVEEEHVIEDKEVKYKTETSYDSTLAYGTVKVTQEGIDGLQRVTQKIQYENGYIVNAVVINTEELKPTVNKVIVKGTYSASGPIVIGDESEWAWPTEQPAFLSSFYQWRCLGGACSFHDGIDIYGPGKNSPIFASKSGNVYSSGWNVNGGGNQVVINHNNGYYTVYAHMNSIVRTMVPGQAVKQGQIIGYMGSTGYTTGVHLHFGIFTGAPPYYGGKSFNPMTLFR